MHSTNCRRLLPQLTQSFDAIDARKPDVEQYKVVADGIELLQALLTARDRVCAVAFVLEDALQRLADAWFVVDNKDS